MKARTLRIARGDQRPEADDPKVWFTLTESFAKVLSAGNRDLLSVIAEKSPGSLEQLSEMTGRAKSNLSRTLLDAAKAKGLRTGENPARWIATGCRPRGAAR
jgi:predicted transcriptional regulator